MFRRPNPDRARCLPRDLEPLLLFPALPWPLPDAPAADYQVTENDAEIKIVTPQLEAAVRKQGYVTGVAASRCSTRKRASATRASGWISSTGSWSRAATRPTATTGAGTGLPDQQR